MPRRGHPALLVAHAVPRPLQAGLRACRPSCPRRPGCLYQPLSLSLFPSRPPCQLPLTLGTPQSTSLPGRSLLSPPDGDGRPSFLLQALLATPCCDRPAAHLPHWTIGFLKTRIALVIIVYPALARSPGVEQAFDTFRMKEGGCFRESDY